MTRLRRTFLITIICLQPLIISGFWFWYHLNHPMGNQLTGDASGMMLCYGRLSGLLLAFFALLQILLICRSKWIESSFGLDRLAHAHGIIGFLILILLVLHPVLLTLGQSMENDVSFKEQFIDYCKNYEDVIPAVIAVIIICIAVIVSLFIRLKKIKYEIWYYIHLFLYLAIVFSFSHQLELGSDLNASELFKYYWYALYAFVFINLICYRFLIPILKFHKHRFFVSDITPETTDVCSLSISGLNMEYFNFEPGQFIFVRFLAKGFFHEKHPFSVSGRVQNNKVRISVKALGDFTRKIPDIPIGTRVVIDGPHGIFSLKTSLASKMLLIAGGIGITPIRAIVEKLADLKIDTVLLYFNRTANNIVFDLELKTIQENSSSKLKIINILSSESSWKGEKGKLDRDMLNRLVPDSFQREVFICGPPAMMKHSIKVLKSFGVKAKIHFERFSF